LIKIFRKKKKLIISVAVLLLICYCSIIVAKNLTAQLTMLAQAKAKAMVTATINECVMNTMKDSVQYGDLVTTVKDAEGRITYLQANTVRMNDLAYSVSQQVQASLAQKGEAGIYIKLGAALGNDLFAASGPNIHVKIQLIGSVSCEFTSEFESTGINQTRHKIILVVKTTMKIILPTDSSSVDVNTNLSLFEAIIVGNVPQYYINVPQQEPYLNLVPKGN